MISLGCVTYTAVQVPVGAISWGFKSPLSHCGLDDSQGARGRRVAARMQALDRRRGRENSSGDAFRTYSQAPHSLLVRLRTRRSPPFNPRRDSPMRKMTRRLRVSSRVAELARWVARRSSNQCPLRDHACASKLPPVSVRVTAKEAIARSGCHEGSRKRMTRDPDFDQVQ
jgi:hypothetical protein